MIFFIIISILKLCNILPYEMMFLAILIFTKAKLRLCDLFMIAGLKQGYTSNNDDEAKEKHYRLIQELAQKFKSKHGSIICRELLNLPAGADSPTPSKRTEQYYQERPCENFIGNAAKIINEKFFL